MSNGLALVDIAQCALIYAWSTSELYGSDPTPAIQLQLSEVSSPSPVEQDIEDDDMRLPRSETSSPRKPPLSPKSSANVISLFRRNTVEFAASIRERYRETRREHTDRPDTELGEDALLTASPSKPAQRCQSERHRGIMRHFTKKKTKVTRSLSFQSPEKVIGEG
ncbi:unnamed protein product [Strongylus vulgaris]|uniref:Uncharacterized protein n=1 Tax=Strongylus vulgaris TaxID=40348 RepID=A0A3P7I390_STRVU|nr:unnamed protein product [Strongylus vulgaris]